MSTVRLPPIGFWSYARQDDQLSGGKLTQLRALLLQDLQQLYGRDTIKLFQDKKTIPHGSTWEREIRKAIGQSSFFVPILTPNFIQSEWCCREVELFFEREAQISRDFGGSEGRGRMFPILFIDVQDIEPENAEVLKRLQALQWFDFTQFRHRPYDEPAVREALSELALSMQRLLRLKLSPYSGEAETVAPAMPIEAAAPPAPEPAPPPEPATRAQPIKVGDVLNHIFEVTRFIRAGGMGQVFEGRNVNTRERVAIKALLPGLAADPKVIDLFNREALTLTRLQHEALVQYRVLAQEPQLKTLYIVTEFIDGVELGDVLATLDRSSGTVSGLLARLASGLAAAHRAGAVHRDVSLDNVMLPGGDVARAKIIDFGIAKDLGAALPTIIGKGFAGKLSFAAPEQLGEYGGEVGPWTDIYSLGLVILAVARGAKVEMGSTFAEAILRRREILDLSSLPDPLRPVVRLMLEADPARRLRSIEEVLERMSRVPVPDDARQPRETEPEAETVVATALGADADAAALARRARRRNSAKVIGGLASAGAAAAAAFWIISPTSEEVPPAPKATAATEGAIETTSSGLRFQILREGVGPTITRADGVMAVYQLRVENGEVLEDTADQSVALIPNSAIPGVSEALTRMREGGSYRVWIPPTLTHGYGRNDPMVAPLGPDDTLEMRIRIEHVERGVAASMQAGDDTNWSENATEATAEVP